MSHASSMVAVVRRNFRRYPLESLALLGIPVLALVLAFPAVAQTGGSLVSEEAQAKAIAVEIAAMQNELIEFGKLPPLPEPDYAWTIRVPITAYSSEPGQTDSTPFITASGSHVRDGIVAANFLPIGTKVRIPRLYGDKVFVVEDRMNKRYYYKMDIWMEETPAARKFGLKNAEVQILKSEK